MSAKTDEILDSLKSLSLLEASELVKQIEEAFGVSAAASAGVVMAAPGAAAGGDGADAKRGWYDGGGGGGGAAAAAAGGQRVQAGPRDPDQE